jgi:hypothetical protein
MGLICLTRTAEPAPQINLVPAEPIDLGSTASAVYLARDVAAATDMPLESVWWSLCNVPDNMLVLLDSPQGWSALAGYISCDLGLPAADYAPEVH